MTAGWIYGIDLGFLEAVLAALRRLRALAVRLAYEIGDLALEQFDDRVLRRRLAEFLAAGSAQGPRSREPG